MDDIMAAQFGMKTGKKTRRGRRGNGFGAKPKADPETDHHAVAQTHIANASASTNPVTTKAHLFKALSSLKKC